MDRALASPGGVLTSRHAMRSVRHAVPCKPFMSLKHRLRSMRAGSSSSARTLVCALNATTEPAAEASASSQEPSQVPKSKTWELDFCSRPILDERGKKVWELLVCDPQRNFEYAQYFPSNKINSAEVRPPAGNYWGSNVGTAACIALPCSWEHRNRWVFSVGSRHHLAAVRVCAPSGTV
jgi:hypothetical protein